MRGLRPLKAIHRRGFGVLDWPVGSSSLHPPPRGPNSREKLMSKKPLNVATERFPGFDAIREDEVVQDLLKKIPQDPSLSGQIAEILKTRLVHSRPYVRLEQDVYDELYQAGVTLDQIVAALAHALIENKTEINVFGTGWLVKYTRPIPIAVVSLFIAFSLLITFVTLGRSRFETEIILLLQFEPLLALAGSIMALGIYCFLKLVLRITGLR